MSDAATLAPFDDAVSLVVGFDLDMTLIDSRDSVRATLVELVAETGAAIDIDEVAEHLGPPLEVALSPWFGPEEINPVCDRYRALHGQHLDLTRPMPGALDAVAALRRRGGRVVVVTSKFEPHARIALRTIGVLPDVLVGWRFGAAKGKVLRDHRAQLYVGDHPGDVAAAKAAGVMSLSVTTGSTPAEALWAAGTDDVLSDLVAFPHWLDERMKAR